MGRVKNLKKTTKTTASDLDNQLSGGYIAIDGVPDDNALPDESLALSVSQLKTLTTKFDTSLADGTPVTNPIGNYTTSTTVADLKTKTTGQIIQDLLFQTLDPTVAAKSLTLSGLPSNAEVGTTLTSALTATFDKGTITNGGNLNVGGSTTTPLVGDINTSFAFTGFYTGTEAGTPTANGSTATVNINSVVELGPNTVTVQISHDGNSTPYYSSDGQISTVHDASRGAATLSATNTVTGFYNIFYGSFADEATIDALTAATRRTATTSQKESDRTMTITTGPTNLGTVIFIRTALGLSVQSAIDINNSNAVLTENFVLDGTVDVNDAGGTPVTYDVYKFITTLPQEGIINITLG